ncbi:MAG: lamin tail domain-containing protein, partial [Cytophagales bacterium]|nr:lamin tail domain-containing protein [Cytophagales bacterium]
LNEPAYFPALKPENFSLGGLTPVFIDQFREAEEILLVFSRKLLRLDSALTARNIFDRKFNKQEYISTKISAHLPFTAHVQFLNARQTWVRFSQDMYRSSYSQDINLSGEIFMEKLEWLNSREMLITWKKEAAKGKSYELDLKRLLNLKTKSLVNPIQKIVFSPFLKEIETDEPYLHLHYREALAQQPLPADKFLWGTYAPSAAVINKNRLSLLFDEFPRNSQRIQVPRLRTASYRCTEPIDSLLFVDRLPPRLDSLTSSFINEITLHFNEAVDFTDVSFQISSEALLSALEKDGQQIRLRFEKLEERQYELSLHSLTDLYGNAFPDTVISFFFRQPVFAEMHQIQLNELMVKTLDKKSHRGTQYAELFNSSNRPFNLRGYRISDRSKSAELNEYILKPGAFVVLCPASKTSYFDKHTSVLGVSSFPVFNQTNEFIRLENPLKKTVDEISYEKEWESIWVKGESIEQINPEYLCSDMSNWESCVDFRRGTPGKPNSVHSSEKKTQAPELLEIYAPSSQKVKLLFDQPIYTDSSTQATGSVPAAAFYADSSNRHVLWIALETTLDFIPQQLSVSNLYNCYGIAADFPEIPFRRLSIPSRDQILFNEILTTETEFVELYNSSDQAFDLSQLKLLKDTLAFEETTAITQETVLLKPKNYLALTRDKTSLLYLYPDLPDESRILESRQIPNLGKDEDALYLVNSRGNVVDAMEYDDSFYRFNFSDGQFRSLEKINPEAESNDARNWSASTAANNYGTPGYANATHLTPEYGDELFISPEYLSISNLHKNRLISMTWQHEKPGWQLSASIYTASGREVIDLTQNEFAGKQTVITWQGEESSGSMVRPGIYLVLVKAYHPDG